MLRKLFALRTCGKLPLSSSQQEIGLKELIDFYRMHRWKDMKVYSLLPSCVGLADSVMPLPQMRIIIGVAIAVILVIIIVSVVRATKH